MNFIMRPYSWPPHELRQLHHGAVAEGSEGFALCPVHQLRQSIGIRWGIGRRCARHQPDVIHGNNQLARDRVASRGAVLEHGSLVTDRDPDVGALCKLRGYYFKSFGIDDVEVVGLVEQRTTLCPFSVEDDTAPPPQQVLENRIAPNPSERR